MERSWSTGRMFTALCDRSSSSSASRVVRGGKEVLRIGADGTFSPLTEAVGNQNASVLQESGDRAVASRKRKIKDAAPGFAVVAGDHFPAVGAPAGVVAEQRHKRSASQRQEGGFAEFTVGIMRNQARGTPALPPVIRKHEVLGESSPEGMMSGNEPSSLLRLNELVRHDSVQGKKTRNGPGSSVVRRFQQQEIRGIRIGLSARVPDPVDQKSESSGRQGKNPGTVVEVGTIFRSFRYGMLSGPCAAPVERFRLHDSGIGSVLVVRALAEHADQGARFRQCDIGPCFVAALVTADRKLENAHEKFPENDFIGFCPESFRHFQYTRKRKNPQR